MKGLRMPLALGLSLLLTFSAGTVMATPGNNRAQKTLSLRQNIRSGSAQFNQRPTATDNQAVPNQVIVKFKGSVNSNKQQQTFNKLGAKTLKKLGDSTKAILVKTPTGRRDAVINSLKKNGLVEYAVPNIKLHPSGVPRVNDPLFSYQWGLNNTGQLVPNLAGLQEVAGTPNADIDAPESWTQRSRGQVLVAVIDTGIDISHPDLRGQIWTNPKEIPGNGRDDDGNGLVDDVHGWNFADGNNQVYQDPFADAHGTHVAGIIAANRDNAIGVAGVASKVKIVPLKFIGSDGSGTLDKAIEAINYAHSIGCQIINASWGTVLDPIKDADIIKALSDAISNSGALFVTSAGNDGSNNDTVYNNPYYNPNLPEGPDNRPSGREYPTALRLPNLISVAAIDSSGNPTTISQDGWSTNYGPNSVDIAAPGDDILSTFPVDGRISSTVEKRIGTSRSAVWGFGLESVKGSFSRVELVARELAYLNGGILNSGRFAPKILLVDDDNSGATGTPYPDCSSFWVSALRTLRLPCDIYRVGAGANGPSAGYLSRYKIVIWESGWDHYDNHFSGTPYQTLTSSDVSNLTSFLGQGRRGLLLSGQDAVWGNEGWAGSYLGAAFCLEGAPLYNLTGLRGTTYSGLNLDISGGDFGNQPFMQDYFAVTNGAAGGLNPEYAYLSGTSMAAPFVSGVAALVDSSHQGMSPTVLKSIILGSVKPEAGLSGKVASGGIVDAYRALQRAAAQ